MEVRQKFSMITTTDLDTLRDSLLNTAGNVPLHTRFRALFTLKSLKNEEAVQIICQGLQTMLTSRINPTLNKPHRFPGFICIIET